MGSLTQQYAQLIRGTVKHGIKAFSSKPAAAGTGYSFELTDTQKEFQDMARKFTREEIIPKAAEYDQSMAFPWDIVKKAWKLGLMNGHVPAHCGGMDIGVFDGCLVAEELAYGCSGMMTALEASGLGVSTTGHLDFRYHWSRLRV